MEKAIIKRMKAAKRANTLAVLNDGKQPFINVTVEYQRDLKKFANCGKSLRLLIDGLVLGGTGKTAEKICMTFLSDSKMLNLRGRYFVTAFCG